MTEQQTEPPLPAPPKQEGPPPEPREDGRPNPKIETGEWVWVVFWRAFPMPGNQRHGTWEKALSRVLSASVAMVCHETSNASIAQEDAAFQGSNLRWTPSERVFRDEKAAEEYRASQPAQN